ncbi:MAG: NifX-associated nitrogen fixation protein [Methylococcales bacterium]|jgi:probable nitrogen fixation protein|nr:NifX-associated nitrogen fixation protein [Methylococcales bacterium]
MSENTQVVAENDPFLTTDVVVEILKQLRAIDTYDTYDGLTEAQIIDPLVLTKERRREIPIIGDPDEITLARVKVYYNSIATLVEKKTKLMAVPVINITHEGFGRAFVIVGKLIVVDKILRDVHRFGFPSLEDLCLKTDDTIEKAAALIDKYHDVAEA